MLLRSLIHRNLRCSRTRKLSFCSYLQSRAQERSFSTQKAENESTFSTLKLDENDFPPFNTLHELQESSCKAYTKSELFGTFNPDSEKFDYMTYENYGDLVDQCRTFLKTIGVKEFDKVGIIANNRWEWAVIAAAVYSLNGTFVPMYESQLPKDWKYILNDSGASVLFCATQDIFDKVQSEVISDTPSVRATFCLDATEGEPHAFSTAMADAKLEAQISSKRIIEPDKEDLANLIYTSGTTGFPKGVELTHLNLTSNIKAARDLLAKNPEDLPRQGDRSLAFLPWAHSYGQTCELWMSMSMGASMGVCRGVDKILDDLQLVQPSILFAVPTLYKKVFEGVQNLIESEDSLQSKLLRRAIAAGHANAAHKRGQRGSLGLVQGLEYRILNRLVLSKVRGRFGGNLRYGCVAGAACPEEVLAFMDAIGIPICEGYGLTETSPIITLNTPSQRLIGSVGRPLDGISVVVADEDGNLVGPGEEGEICCVGPNVMKGYHNNPEATDEVISLAPDGKSRMFHTGDLGRMDEGGWLRITGRLKEQYKLENGKYVVPTPIETAIGMSRFIGQVVLCGANRPYNVALIVPEWPAIRGELGIADDVSEEDLASDERVKDLIDNDISESCYKLKKFEVPTKWAFVAPFTAANNMLTPKMSIRRHKVMEAYEDVISHLYGDDPIVTEAADGAEKTAA